MENSDIAMNDGTVSKVVNVERVKEVTSSARTCYISNICNITILRCNMTPHKCNITTSKSSMTDMDGVIAGWCDSKTVML